MKPWTKLVASAVIVAAEVGCTTGPQQEIETNQQQTIERILLEFGESLSPLEESMNSMKTLTESYFDLLEKYTDNPRLKEYYGHFQDNVHEYIISACLRNSKIHEDLFSEVGELRKKIKEEDIEAASMKSYFERIEKLSNDISELDENLRDLWDKVFPNKLLEDALGEYIDNKYYEKFTDEASPVPDTSITLNSPGLVQAVEVGRSGYSAEFGPAIPA